ncbi:MAG: ribose 5-phosphate isomerase B [Candidatus Omnitrophica bacterium]|nr:ribose 5-phosphate isomerase B [Candidatus Omnitrophota bacterium]MCM8791203.1 ribose 5-phosphate isomerase B [Candidatus Omnitrophota bacterium]
MNAIRPLKVMFLRGAKGKIENFNRRFNAMKIAIGSDHGGYELKNEIVQLLTAEGHEVVDKGTHSKDSCDYPLIGFEVAKDVSEGRADRGVLICKTGVGMVIIANKVHGVRAAACYDVEMARLSREHNDCNVIVLAANYTNSKKSAEILKAWLAAEHSEERHVRRVKQIKDIESKMKGR